LIQILLLRQEFIGRVCKYQ